MEINFGKFIQQFIHFFAGNVFTVFLGLVTFPLLTRYLTKEQYGTLGLITTTMMLLVAVGKGGLSEGIVRFYKESAAATGGESGFASTVIIRGIKQAVVTVLLYLLGMLYVARVWGMASDRLSCFMIMSGALFVRPLSIMILNLMRVKGNSLLVNGIGVTNRVLSVLFSLALLFCWLPNFSGYFLGLVLADLVVLAVLWRWFWANYEISWSRNSPVLAARLLRFGWPLLLSELAYLLISYGDRYLIAVYWGNDAVGEYAAGYNLANYISGVITFALSFAIIPAYVEIFTREGREKTEEFLEKSMGYLLIGIIPICLGYYAVADDLFLLLTGGRYMGAARFSPIILLGTFALGVNSVLYAGLYLENKSGLILAISLGAVLLNLLLNWSMLPVMGVMGAAIATLLTSLAMNLLTVCLAFPYIRIRVSGWLVLRYLAVSLVMVVLIKLQPVVGWLELLEKIALGMLLVGGAVLVFEKEAGRSLGQWCHRCLTY